MTGDEDVPFLHEAFDNRYILRLDEIDVTHISAGQVADDVLRASFQSVLDCMGAPPEETTLIVGTLARAGGPLGKEPVSEAVARKVYAERRVFGVPLPQDYAVSTFSMSGRLLGFHGRWRRLDYANSDFVIEGLTVDDVLLKAAEWLIAKDVQLSPTVFSIEVSTLYHAQPSETTSLR